MAISAKIDRTTSRDPAVSGAGGTVGGRGPSGACAAGGVAVVIETKTRTYRAVISPGVHAPRRLQSDYAFRDSTAAERCNRWRSNKGVR